MGKIDKNGRRPTNLSLNKELVDQAKALDVNLSRAAEQGVEQAVKQAKKEQWQRENADAIQYYNDWVEKNGLPLSDLQVLQLKVDNT